MSVVLSLELPESSVVLKS